MVLSMLSVSLLLNTQNRASSQSPTRRFIPSAQRNCSRSSMRVNIPGSSCETQPSTPCRVNTSLSSRKWCPPTICVWDASAEVRSRYKHRHYCISFEFYFWIDQRIIASKWKEQGQHFQHHLKVIKANTIANKVFFYVIRMFKIFF